MFSNAPDDNSLKTPYHASRMPTSSLPLATAQHPLTVASATVFSNNVRLFAYSGASMNTFDVVVIGGGPGGAKAAGILARGGKSVALVENSHLGGVCLNCGCIPTKLLLGATAPKGLLRGLERQRVAKGSIEVDYDALQKRIQRFIKGSAQALGKSLEQLGVTLIEGRAVCTGPTEVLVTGTDGSSQGLHAQHIILAGGSRSAAFPGMAPDHVAVLDSTDMLRIAAVPESLIVVGAGAIGLEMADFFSAMGSKVTIVEAAPHLAPTEDADVGLEMGKLLGKTGITCITGVKAASLTTSNGMATLALEDGRELTAAKALVAVGRTPNTDGLGAESAGCTLQARGYVTVDQCLMASPTVYAIGDINGQTLLAHAAEHQGAYVARHILGQQTTPYASGPIPSCVYGSLEIMRVGITARQALASGGKVEVARAQLMGNAIAQAGGDASGFVKIVWHNGALAGISALGHGVSHLVTAAQLLLLGQYHGDALHAFMFAHPTLDEALHAALEAPREVVTA